jgi:hypothetical protein
LAYDFRALSPYDFEHLVRDLLKSDLHIAFQLSPPGPDGGLDLYHQSPQGLFVVQCKHYVDSGVERLKRVLKRLEAPKVRLLAPHRYGLATSVRLTFQNKNHVLKIFSPYLTTLDHVWGSGELNDLLTTYSDVERSHYKLWLTSSGVLRSILAAEVINRTTQVLSEAEHKTKIYVKTFSYSVAGNILEREHVCIISGEPGIGKTILAQMLTIEHLHAGYQLVTISGDVSEAERLYQPEIAQLFYYDDFLGPAGDMLMKNEDSRLTAFMGRVSSSDNKRLILTTREYVLQAAVQKSERLALSGHEFIKCIVSLQTYTLLERAKILYNLVYFSQLSRPARQSLVDNHLYLRLTRHSNFSPRLIEFAIRTAPRVGFDSLGFGSSLEATFEKPTLVRGHVFENDLSPQQRKLLTTLAVFPNVVSLDDLYEAARAVAPDVFLGADRLAIYGAMRRMDGTFVALKKQGKHRFVTFANHSIQDYTIAFLCGDVQDCRDSVSRAIYFEHAQWFADRAFRAGPYPDATALQSSDLGDSILQALCRTIFSDGVGWSATAVLGSAGVLVKTPVSYESRLVVVLGESERIGALDEGWLQRTLAVLQARWQGGMFERYGLLRLSEFVALRQASLGKHFLDLEGLIERCLLRNLQSASEFDAALTYLLVRRSEAIPDSDTSLFDALETRFRRYLGDTILELQAYRGNDIVADVLELKRACDNFNVRDNRLVGLERTLRNLENDEDRVPEHVASAAGTDINSEQSDAEIHKLFSTLLHGV